MIRTPMLAFAIRNTSSARNRTSNEWRGRIAEELRCFKSGCSERDADGREQHHPTGALVRERKHWETPMAELFHPTGCARFCQMEFSADR